MLVKAYVIVAYVAAVVSSSADLDPCLSGSHRNITHLNERYTKLKDDCPYTDHRIEKSWFYAGADPIVTFPPDYCACGYKFPIWMNGTLPSASEGVVDRLACLKFLSSCHQTLDIQIKNCGKYFVYHLTPGPDDSGYCFDYQNHFYVNDGDYQIHCGINQGIDKPKSPDATPGHIIEQIPNATLEIQQGTITSDSFFTAINVSSDNEVNVTAAILLQDGSLLQSVQIDKMSLVYKWDNLRPTTNYTVQIYAYVTGEQRVLAAAWALTKQLLPPEITVSVDVPPNSIASDSFTFKLNVTVGFDSASLKADIVQADGTVTDYFVVDKPVSVHFVGDLMPATNYTVEVYTTFQGRRQIIASRWIMTEQYRKATANIEVLRATISKESLGIHIIYDHGSEHPAAEGTMQFQNGTVVRSFQVGTPVSSQSFQTLTAGTRYSVEVHIIRRGERIVLDQVWVFTQPEIQAYLSSMPAGEPVSRYTTFRCKFEPSPQHIYGVRWTVQRTEKNFTIDKMGASEHALLDLELTEKDLLKQHVHIPFNVSCAVSVKLRTISQNDFSVPSDTLFAGIKILTRQLIMHRDETKVIKLIPTVPFGCYTTHDGTSPCNLTLSVSIPVRKNCTGISTRSCSLQIHGDVDTEQYLQIQALEDGQYGVLEETTYDVILRTASLDNSIWSNYVLPIVKVTVQPERDTYWRGKRCEALNDPHMYTFDAVRYEHHESLSDEYVMYAHTSFRAKVHHKLERCNTNAMCNCGVAVQAGRDIYLISTCNNVMEIGYKQCDDGVLLVKQETDMSYTIYLPYGTYVKARLDKTPYLNSMGGMIVSVSVFPSVHDQHGRSNGLCGTLDNNRMNDFHGRGGELNLTRTEFIHDWRVSKDDSLFKPDVKSAAPWMQPACTCSVTSGEFTVKRKCRLGADESCSRGRTVGEKTCKMAEKQYIESNEKQNIPILDLNTDGNHKDSVTTQKRPDVTAVTPVSHIPGSKSPTTSAVHWDQAKAKDFCTGYMNTSRAFRLCARVPYTDTERAIETCTQDIVITQTTEWHRISRQSMQDSCISEIHRNETVRDDLERPRQSLSTLHYRPSKTVTPSVNTMGNVTKPSSSIGIKDSDLNIFELVDALEEIACPNECSDHGTCKNGTCKCNSGFGSSDCSIDLKKPPSTASLLHGTTCDEKDAECTHVFIYGGFFASETVRCHVTTFETHVITKGRQNMDAYVLPGQAQSLIEVICPLRSTRRKRSVPDTQDVKLISCYRVSVSNDGIHHGSPLEMCIYNSKCQRLSNGSDGLITASIKEGFCFIDGKCIPSGMKNPSATTYCESQISLYNWAEKPTSTVEPVTETTSYVVITHVDTQSAWKTPVIVTAACICAVCIFVTVLVCIRKKKRRKTASKKKEKEDVIVSYKHDPDVDEEVYAHINPIDVSDDLPFEKQSTPDESHIGGYTRLDITSKEKLQYAKLNAVDEMRKEGGPTLPDRYQSPRIRELGSSDPYQRLDRSSQNEKVYDTLNKPDEYYLTPQLQLDVSGISPKRKNLYIDLTRDEDFSEGYERPDPQYKSHYKY